jgi:hypothetical protein
MYDTLLFLHVLSAFLLVVTVVVLSAAVLGAPAPRRVVVIANRCWDLGGLGTLVLGIWLAIYLDAYHPWDGWIIAALVLWVAMNGFGYGVKDDIELAATEGPVGAVSQRVATIHWIRTAVVVALLAVMIFKPGA